MAEIIIKIVLGALLLFCGIQDTVKKRINLWIIVVGAGLTIGCLPFCDTLSILSRMGGCAVGLSVITISRITGGKIGMGDGILLCVTGLGLGFWSNLELFGIALFIAAIISIILLALQFVDRKKSIPFIPFLLAGYVLMLVATKGTLV